MVDFETTIATESVRFADAIRSAEPDAPVPTCPEWVVQDLAWHLTDVHAFWARILRSGAFTDEQAEEIEDNKPDQPGSFEEILGRFDAETKGLLDQLAAREDTEPAWFWLDTAKTVGSTKRMQAHEATMHRVDAELAAGKEPSPIPAELAADGIRHAFEVMWAWWGTVPGIQFQPTGGVVELATADANAVLIEPGRWQGVGQSGNTHDVPAARLAADGAAGAHVTGTAEELMRWLWGRGAEPVLEGDPRLLAALREARAQGMQ